MKTVLILSGGTGTAWSLCNAFRRIGKSDVRVIVCDINPAWLIHSSTIADEFIQVPPIASPNYYNTMLNILDEYNVDIIVPLIDMDIRLFSKDNVDLVKMKIISTAPNAAVFDTLSDKKKMAQFLPLYNIPTPRVYSSDEVDDNTEYYVKPIVGFGSRGSRKMNGYEIKKLADTKNILIQEMCDEPEITADVFCYNDSIRTLCRERIETKAGVCTKARVFHSAEIEQYLIWISKILPLPVACCVQFMKSVARDWMLTDFNLRIGAGSALSAAVGFDLADSAVAVWLGLPDNISITISQSEHFVVRYYSEVVTK